MVLKTRGSRRAALVTAVVVGVALPLAILGRLDRTDPHSAAAGTGRSTGKANAWGPRLTEPRGMDEPFAQLIAASTGTPRVQNATIEFLPLGGVRLRHATIETHPLGGLRLRNSTIETQPLGASA